MRVCLKELAQDAAGRSKGRTLLRRQEAGMLQVSGVRSEGPAGRT